MSVLTFHNSMLTCHTNVVETSSAVFLFYFSCLSFMHVLHVSSIAMSFLFCIFNLLLPSHRFHCHHGDVVTKEK